MGAASVHRDPAMTPEVFAEFYQRTFREVYRYLYRAVLGDRMLAEDLTQETFASVVGAVRDGRAEVNSIPWMIGVARHKLVDHYRKTDSEHRRIEQVWGSVPNVDDEHVEDLDREDPAALLEILRDVSPAHRLVLVLRFVDDLTVGEIARLIGRSIHATESLLVRARRELVLTYRGPQT
jgi:RNA polymerase sigma-70 factor (ECF subfamily)